MKGPNSDLSKMPPTPGLTDLQRAAVLETWDTVALSLVRLVHLIGPENVAAALRGFIGLCENEWRDK